MLLCYFGTPMTLLYTNMKPYMGCPAAYFNLRIIERSSSERGRRSVLNKCLGVRISSFLGSQSLCWYIGSYNVYWEVLQIFVQWGNSPSFYDVVFFWVADAMLCNTDPQYLEVSVAVSIQARPLLKPGGTCCTCEEGYYNQPTDSYGDR